MECSSKKTDTIEKGITLKDPGLFRQASYIDGAWVTAPSGAVITVDNPATGEAIGTVPKLGAAETRQAIDAAARAFDAWRTTTAKDRAIVMRRWFDLMIANRDDLARLMTTEQGKPLAESRGEVTYAASFLEWFGEEAKRVYGDTIPGHQADKRIVVIKQPIGVVACITPWNFPLAMITRKAGPAIAAGCTVVLKPASQTPFSALALAELAQRAGVPKGVLNVITGSATDIGGELTSNPDVRKLSFTGSTETGKLLMAQCASTVKKTLARARRQRAVHRVRRRGSGCGGGRSDCVEVSQHRPDVRLCEPHPRAGQRLRCLCHEACRRGAHLAAGPGPRCRCDAGSADRRPRRQESGRAHQRCARERRPGRDWRPASCARRPVLRTHGARGRHARRW